MGPSSFAIVLLILGALLSPIWRGRVTPHWDGSEQFAPYFSLVADHARQGRLVTWNPWTDAGMPLFIEPQAAAMSPLTVLSGLVFGPTERGYRLYWCLLWLMAGAGMWLLARHLRAPAAVATAIALGYALSGLFCGNAEHTSWVYATALLPWIVWRWDAVLLTGSVSAALQAGGLAGLCGLGGYPGLFISTVGFCGLWAAGRALSGAVVWRPAGWVCAALMMVVVASPLYASFAYEGRGFSARAGALSRADALNTNYLSPSAAWTLISPAFAPLKQTHPNLWPMTDMSSVSLYTGLVPLLWAVLALAVRGRARWRLSLAAIAVLAFMTACGPDVPLRGWLYDLLPPFRYFRHPSLFRAFAVLALCALAAETGRAWDERATERWRLVAVAVPCALLLAVGYRYFETRVVGVPVDHVGLTVCILVPLLFVVALAMPPSAVGRGVAAAALVIAAAVDGAGTFRLSVPTIYETAPSARAYWDMLNRAHTPSLALESLFRSMGPGTNNDNLLTKVPELKNYSALASRRVEAVVQSPEARAMLTDGNKVWFMPEAPFAPATEQAAPALRAQLAHGPTFVVHSRAAMLNPNDTGPLPTEPLARAQPADVRLVRYEPARLTFDWIAPSDGWLFVGDSWARSWEARVNGRRVEVDGANLGFRAIRVPAGSIRVDMRYRPRLRLLVWLSWPLLLMAIASAVWVPRRWRAYQSAPSRR